MTRMTRKDVPLVWNDVAQELFDQLKKVLSEAPILAFPNPQKPFILHTDGSSHGVRAILSQIGDDGKEHIIHYASHALNPAQASYAPTHLEALAVVWAVNKFRSYLWGRKFTLRTDHSALVSVLKGTKPLTGMLARWAAFLQEYQYNAKHVQGKHNPADAPSRLVSAIEESPTDIPFLRKYLETNELPDDAVDRRRIKRKASTHYLQDGSLYRKDGKKIRKVLETQEDRLQALSQLHDENGHPGINNTLVAINQRFWWPKIFEQVQDYVHNCESCKLQAKPTHREQAHPIPVEGLFARWEIDLVGPLPFTPRGKRFIAVAVEGLTRWPEAAPLSQKTGAEVGDFIYSNIYCRYGSPRHIQTDNGLEFKNDLVAQLLKKWKIQHHFSMPYHPQSNGLVERYNKTLCNALARQCQGQDWDLHIDQCLLAYRTIHQATTHRSPASLLFGQELTLLINLHHDGRACQPATVQELKKQIEALQKTLPEERRKAKERTEQNQELQHQDRVSPAFQEGDRVYRHLG